MMMRNRLAKLEATTSSRTVVATVPHGATFMDVAVAAGFDPLPTDTVVIINKPEGCPAGSLRVNGGAA